MPLGVPVRFGSYYFPDYGVTEFHDNFKNSKPRTVSLPGMDGGYNEDGDQPSASEIGQVQIGFRDDGTGPESLDDVRDAVAEMASWGDQILVYQPSKPGDPLRYCVARIQYITDTQVAEQDSDTLQKFKVFFQVPYPRWLVNNYWGWYLGMPGIYLGAPGLYLGSGGYEVEASGLTTTDTLPYVGNARAPVKVTIEPQAGQTCENPKIERLLGAQVVDRFQYTGTLEEGDILTVYGPAGWATLNGVAVWDDFTYMGIDLFRVDKDAPDIKITFANSGDEATVRFYYFDEYR